MNNYRYVTNKNIRTKKHNLKKVLGPKTFKNFKITVTCLSILSFLGLVRTVDYLIPNNRVPSNIDYSNCKINNLSLYDMDPNSLYEFKNINFFSIINPVLVSYEYININGHYFKVNYVYIDKDFLPDLRDFGRECLKSVTWINDKVLSILEEKNIEFNFIESVNCLLKGDKYTYSDGFWKYGGWVNKYVNNVNIPYIPFNMDYRYLCVIHEIGHVYDNILFSMCNNGNYGDFVSTNSDSFIDYKENEINSVYYNMSSITFSNYTYEELNKANHEYFAESFKIYFAGYSDISEFKEAKMELKEYAPYTYSYIENITSSDNFMEIHFINKFVNYYHVGNVKIK